MNRLKSTVADASADVVENLGKLDPRRLFGGENPFLETANSLRESADASSAFVEELKNQEIRQSAAIIQAQVLAEANRELANSINQVNSAQGGSAAAPAPSRPGIEVTGNEDIFVDPLSNIPEMTAESADSVGVLIEQMLGLGDALGVVTEKTEENEEATKGAQKAFRSYSANSIRSIDDLKNATRGEAAAFVQAQLVKALAGSAAVEFASKGIFGAITAAAAGIAVKKLFDALPGFADGVTNFKGGAAIVGERGPELATFGQGTNIVTNENLSKLFQKIDSNQPMGSPTVNVPMNELVNEIKGLRADQKHMQVQIDYFGLQDGLDRHGKNQERIDG